MYYAALLFGLPEAVLNLHMMGDKILRVWVHEPLMEVIVSEEDLTRQEGLAVFAKVCCGVECDESLLKDATLTGG